MSEGMCNKSCSGPITSCRNKWMTGVYIYPSNDTKHYQLTRLHKLEAIQKYHEKWIMCYWTLSSAIAVHHIFLSTINRNAQNFIQIFWILLACMQIFHKNILSEFTWLSLNIHNLVQNSHLLSQLICDQIFPDTYLDHISTCMKILI